ncbi:MULTISPECIES: hypothetical protein [Paenibacillus]|uniref:hypothetical protein n=1 Tax=Paenibacillus TaxID=44249 RepID=UPI0010B4E67A|nr:MULTISPECIES: hypothetical protein [Paenibacillus]GCL74840.1 hypothetical protein PN4B1_48220 [Paenibacillus naphthalenovorans]
MIKIQSLTDLHALHNGLSVPPLTSYLYDLFSAACAETNHDEQADHLLHNPIFLCEPMDNLPLRFSEAPFGIEYVEKIELPELLIYRICIMLDNDWLAHYIVPAGILDEPTERWLIEKIRFGGIDNG